MAIIYSFPNLPFNELNVSDTLIINDTNNSGEITTRTVTLKNLADFVTSTGTGTGTTNAIIKWSDGPAGLLGDSIMNEDTDKINLNGILRIAESNNRRLEIKYGSDSDTSHINNAPQNNQIIGRAGDLIIKNRARTRDILFQADNGEYDGNVTTYFRLDGSMADIGNPDLYTRWGDNSRIVLGNTTNANNLDFEMYHDGSATYMKNGSFNLIVESKGGVYIENKSGGSGDIDITQSVTNADVNITAYNGNYFKADTSAGATIFSKPVQVPLVPTVNANAASKQYVDQQISSIPAGLVFQGNWNASTNTPTLASGVGTVGNYYVVSVAGNTNLDGITDWEVGDWAVFVEVGGVDKWDKIDQTFVQGAGAIGQVSFWNGINSVTGDNNLYWDNSNKRLGVGTTSPGVKLQIGSATHAPDGNLVNNLLQIKSPSGLAYLTIGNGDTVDSTSYIGGASGFLLFGSVTDAGVQSEHIRMTNTGNVGIGTTSPDSLLHVSADVTVANIGTITIEGRPAGFLGDDIATIDFHNNGSKLADIRMERGNAFNDSQLVFSTSDTGTLNDALIINEIGSVGIGTTSPGAKLDIVSASNQIKLSTGTAGDGYLNIGHFANGTFIGTYGDDSGAADLIRFGTHSGDERMRITSGGDVGIGTSSPSAKLEVANAAEGAYLIAGGDNVNNGRALVFTSSTSGVTNGALHTINAQSGNGVIAFSTASTERMRITSGGNVGIGTTSPDAKLDVNGGVNGTHAIFSGQDGRGLKISTENTLNNDDGVVYDAQTSTGKHLFKIAGTERMRITSAGNVGIGTTNPSQKLSLPDNAKIGLGDNADLQIHHNGTVSAINNAVGNIQIYQNADDADIQFFCDDGSGGTTEYFRLDGGIESMVASKDILFNDNIRAEFGNAGDFDIYHDGTNTYLQNTTGDLSIINYADDGDIKFFSDDGSGGVTEYFKLDGGDSSANPLTVFPDNARAGFGASGDLQIYHDGSNSFIQDTGTGNLIISSSSLTISNAADTEFMAKMVQDAQVELYYNGSKKLETTSTGTKTTGQMDLAALNTAVTNSDDNGTPGEIRFTANYIYVCIADDQWKRVALSTW